MHTSTVLQSSDFRYRRVSAAGTEEADFAALCPNYHELDRVGVVSPHLEDGILHLSYTLLAITTAFYDAMRARATDFFNYPQHFALIGGSETEIQTRAERLPLRMETIGGPWGNLDVWPETNWTVVPATETEMLKRVFALQINRLFWPEAGLPFSESDTLLPDYALSILRARLKTVTYYATASPTLEIAVTEKVESIAQGSIRRLPAKTAEAISETRPHIETLRQVPPEDFLTAMAHCFAMEV